MKRVKAGWVDAIDMQSYRGVNPYKEVGRTYRSASEAFKDADYATAIWRCETDWDRTKDYLIPLLAFILAGVLIYLFCEGLTKWIPN